MLKLKEEFKPNLPPYTNASSVVKSTPNSLNGHEFVETIPFVYDEIVEWRKNLFKLPSGNKWNGEKIFSSFLPGIQPKCSYENLHHGLNILTVTLSISPLH